MTVFDDCHHLVHEVTSHSVQNLLEEVLVVVELEGELKLELEVLPDRMILTSTCRWLQSHLVL